MLAAIAGRTERIHLGSAVTVLSSDDPVRVFQRFATLDAVSGGRAEVILGRGSFTESFPLFGLAARPATSSCSPRSWSLFAQLRHGGAGALAAATTRAPLDGQTGRARGPSHGAAADLGRRRRQPRVGRAGGRPRTAADARDHRRRERPVRAASSTSTTGRSPSSATDPQPVGVHSPGHVAATDEQALEEYWPHWKPMRDRIGAERGWPPASAGGVPPGRRARRRDVRRVARDGRPQDRDDGHGRSGLSRFDLKYSAGTLPHAALLRSIELYGTEVAPRVHELLAERGGVSRRAGDRPRPGRAAAAPSPARAARPR